jgi:hypothetical protein
MEIWSLRARAFMMLMVLNTGSFAILVISRSKEGGRLCYTVRSIRRYRLSHQSATAYSATGGPEFALLRRFNKSLTARMLFRVSPV